MIFDSDNVPFSDVSVANQVAAVLSRETDCPYVVTHHDSGGYVLVKTQSVAVGEAVPHFDEIRFRPAWRSQLGKLFSILLGLTVFILSDVLLVLLHIDQLLILLQSQGLLDQSLMIGAWMSGIVSLVGLAYAGFAALSACYFIYSHDYFIGPRGIEENEGIVSKDQSRIEFKHIRGVNLRQSIFQRLLGIGTIDIATSGSEESEVRFVGITNPKRCLATLRKRLKALV